MTNTGDELGRGWQIHQTGDHATAEKIYRSVVEREPNNANAWCYLGMALHDQERYDESVQAYRRSLGIQPQFPVALNNLGNSLRLLRRIKEATACFDEAIRLKPDYLNAHKNKGTTLLWEGFIDEALACYQAAVKLDADDAESHKNIGVIWLLQGKLAEGWKEYEWRQKAIARLVPEIPLPRWQGESLDGRTILLVGEQGLGDTIQFIRYAEELKKKYACRVAVQILRPVLPLLAGYAPVDEFAAIGDPLPVADVWTPLMSLPGMLAHNSPEQLPSAPSYLDVDAARVARWRERLGEKRAVRIGVCWSGSPQFQADRYRSFALRELLAPLAKLHGIELYSLQRGPGSPQREIDVGGLQVQDLGDELDAETPFLDTAAVMKNLDLVITADTSIGHLAGALGVPYWLALSKVPDWRWMLDRDDSPWYPSVRLFRQSKMGQWSDVFQRMADALVAAFPTVRPKRPEEYRAATTGFQRLTHARYGLCLYNRNDLYIGRSIEQYGEFSEGECDLFRQLLRPGAVLVEAGANIGAHTLALSQIAGPTGRVIAFEPQRVIFQTLCANVALNSLLNVDCRWQAVGATAGTLLVPALDYEKENNFGGLGLGDHQRGASVPVTTIDSLKLERCDFIKADVEGMELDVLRGAADTIRRFRPLLYLENDRREKSPALLSHLLESGYRVYWHLPPMYNPLNYYGNAANIFPHLVSVNLLAVHSSLKANIIGLKEIASPEEFWRE